MTQVGGTEVVRKRHVIDQSDVLRARELPCQGCDLELMDFWHLRRDVSGKAPLVISARWGLLEISALLCLSLLMRTRKPQGL